MDWQKFLNIDENEKPLDSFPSGISNTAVFRTIGFVGDSLASGEFESRGKDGNAGYHDMFEYSWGTIYRKEKRSYLTQLFKRWNDRKRIY